MSISTIFMILSTLSILAIFIGLIKPSLVLPFSSKKGRIKATLTYFLASMLFIILSASTMTAEEKKQADKIAKEEAAQQALAKANQEKEVKQKEEQFKKDIEYIKENDNQTLLKGNSTYIERLSQNEYFIGPTRDDFKNLSHQIKQESKGIVKRKDIEQAMKGFTYEEVDNDEGIFTVLGDGINAISGDSTNDVYYGYTLKDDNASVIGFLSKGIIGRDHDKFKKILLGNIKTTNKKLVNNVVREALGSWAGDEYTVLDWIEKKQEALKLSAKYYYREAENPASIESGVFVKKFDDYEVYVKAFYKEENLNEPFLYQIAVQNTYLVPICGKIKVNN